MKMILLVVFYSFNRLLWYACYLTPHERIGFAESSISCGSAFEHTRSIGGLSSSCDSGGGTLWHTRSSGGNIFWS